MVRVILCPESLTNKVINRVYTRSFDELWEFRRVQVEFFYGFDGTFDVFHALKNVDKVFLLLRILIYQTSRDVKAVQVFNKSHYHVINVKISVKIELGDKDCGTYQVSIPHHLGSIRFELVGRYFQV